MKPIHIIPAAFLLAVLINACVAPDPPRMRRPADRRGPIAAAEPPRHRGPHAPGQRGPVLNGGAPLSPGREPEPQTPEGNGKPPGGRPLSPGGRPGSLDPAAISAPAQKNKPDVPEGMAPGLVKEPLPPHQRPKPGQDLKVPVLPHKEDRLRKWVPHGHICFVSFNGSVCVDKQWTCPRAPVFMSCQSVEEHFDECSNPAGYKVKMCLPQKCKTDSDCGKVPGVTCRDVNHRNATDPVKMCVPKCTVGDASSCFSNETCIGRPDGSTHCNLMGSTKRPVPVRITGKVENNEEEERNNEAKEDGTDGMAEDEEEFEADGSIGKGPYCGFRGFEGDQCPLPKKKPPPRPKPMPERRPIPRPSVIVCNAASKMVNEFKSLGERLETEVEDNYTIAAASAIEDLMHELKEFCSAVKSKDLDGCEVKKLGPKLSMAFWNHMGKFKQAADKSQKVKPYYDYATILMKKMSDHMPEQLEAMCSTGSNRKDEAKKDLEPEYEEKAEDARSDDTGRQFAQLQQAEIDVEEKNCEEICQDCTEGDLHHRAVTYCRTQFEEVRSASPAEREARIAAVREIVGKRCSSSNP